MLKRLALALLGDYAIYKVWRLATPMPPPVEMDALVVRPLQPGDLEAPEVAAELAGSRWYQGAQSCGFGCFDTDGRLLAIAFYWWEQRYAQRGSWPIEAQAAKLVHIVTAPAARGRGIATLLIQASAAAMQAQGRGPLYARIWHSNTPSQRAFARAGWQPCGWLLQVNPLRRARPWNLYRKQAGTASSPR